MKIGVLVDNLGPSQLAYNVIQAGNHLSSDDFIVFYDSFVKPCIPPNFAIMQTFEAWGYDGAIIATKLSSASNLCSFPMVKDRVFYVWDLEWLRMKNKNFRVLADTYRNPKLKLVARSASHKKIIEDCWNVNVAAIVDDFDINKFREVLSCQN